MLSLLLLHADMLGVGVPGISDVEGRSQFSLWCLLGAPLFLGAQLATVNKKHTCSAAPISVCAGVF